jgi:PST family polysaccharide transporter
LGTSQYGLLIFVTAIMQYFVIFTDYGFNLTATRRIATVREDGEELSRIYSNVLFLKLALMLLSFLILLPIIFIIPKFNHNYSAYLFGFLIVVGNVLFPLWFYQGMEKMKYISFLSIGAKLISTVLILLFVKNTSDVPLTLIFQSLSFLIPGVIGQFIAITKFSINLTFNLNYKELIIDLKEGTDVFIATISGNVYGQGAVVITGLIGGQSAAGYYGIIQKITGALIGLVQPLAQGVYPYLCTLFNKDTTKYFKLRKSFITFGIFLGGAVGLLLFFFTDKILKLVSGEINLHLVILGKLFSFILLLTMLNVLLNGFILSMNKGKELKKMYMIIALIFLCLSIPLTFLFDEVGMGCSILFVELFICLNSLIITRERGFYD